jgi:hypothetical protein
MVESAEEITGGAMTGESEGHIRDLDAQLAQNRHVQWCRLLNPASTTPFCPFGSTMVGVAGVSGGPEPEPGLRPGGFMASEPCRGLVTRQFGSGVGSSDGGWTGSGRVRCGGSCETWRWWCEKSAVETRDSLAQIICVLGCPRSAAWLVSGLGEILHPFGFDRGKAAHRCFWAACSFPVTARQIAETDSSVEGHPCCCPVLQRRNPHLLHAPVFGSSRVSTAKTKSSLSL